MSENTVCEAGGGSGGPKKNLFDKVVIGSFSSIAVVSAFALTLLISAATFVRYVLQGDLYGYEEWVKLIAFWLYFSGAAIGAYNGTHVSADLVDAYVAEGFIKRFLAFLKSFITVSVMALYVWYGYDFFMFGFMGPMGTGIAIPMTTIWRIPLWTSYLGIFLGFIFMLYYFAVELFRNARMLFIGGKS